MSEPTKEQLDKLPKWAQKYVGDLILARKQAERETAAAQGMFTKGESKQTWRAIHSLEELDMPESRVRFYFDERRQVHLDVMFREIVERERRYNVLDIRASRGLKVQPMAYNSAYIECEE